LIDDRQLIVEYALSAWGGYISQSLKDRIDACFRKAYR